MKETKAIVLGNGKSRLEFDLNLLANEYYIYGCNALYREFIPDYLIAVDPNMVREILEANYCKKVYSYNRLSKIDKRIKYIEPNRGWASGPTAVKLAARHKHNEIYLLGFDINSNTDFINNVYAGTKNYKSPDSKKTYFSNWVNQLCTVFSEHPQTQFIRILTREYNFIPKEFKEIPNLIHKSTNTIKMQ